MKLLVELDVHSGLLEALDIEWRGKTYGQKLNYLGIQFRCSLCRRTGHLQKECYGFVLVEETESSMLRKTVPCEFPGVDSYWSGEGTSTEEDARISPVMDSDVGKLNKLCPSFFSTLTVSELVSLTLILSPFIGFH